jgi:hypothetical protein
MVRISKNNLSIPLQNELKRLSTIGDLIGGVDTFSHLPTENDDFGEGASIIASVTKIKSHDLVIVSDATEDSRGLNAIYEASTSETEGDDVTWSYVMNMVVPIPKRVASLSTTVQNVLDGNVTVDDDVKNIWDSDPQAVEVFVNGLYETGFTFDSSKKLVLTNYPTEGWTNADTVEIFIWQAA